MDGARRRRRRSGSRVRSVSPAQQASPSGANRIKGHHENTKSTKAHEKDMPQRHKDTETERVDRRFAAAGRLAGRCDALGSFARLPDPGVSVPLWLNFSVSL